MSAPHGEQLAALLDKGLNLLPLLPDDHIIGIGASYFGEGGMLSLDQSPYLENARFARLRILGTVAGMGTYGDESKFTFALSNNVSLPDGTHVQLREPKPEQTELKEYRLPEGALDASYAISSFLRTILGDLWTVRLGFDTESAVTVKADVSGVFTTDEMRAAYLETLGNGTIVDEHVEPTTAKSTASMTHTVLTPTVAQVITFSMSDHRPGNREEMLRLQRDQT